MTPPAWPRPRPDFIDILAPTDDSSADVDWIKAELSRLGVDELEAVADRGYYGSEEILACDKAGITVTLPKPVTSGIKAKGRFGKQDLVNLSDEDVYRCPAGEKLAYHYTNEANGLGRVLINRNW